MRRVGSRLLVSAASLALALVVSEGLLSLVAGTSWRTLLDPSAPAPLVATDEERFHAAALTPGPYRITEDPFVGYALKASTEVDTLEGRPEGLIRTDELGLRPRPGPPPGLDALRIVVLGDSVAFGYGLRDDEVLAAALEQVLRAALGPGGREVACFTVATPSWNYRNALRFLLDHMERLDPDLVLYLPVKNDLEDSYGVTEAGQRRYANDPVVPGARLCFRLEMGVMLLAKRTRSSLPDPSFGGPEVHYAGLTASSRWRLADLAESLVRAEERLARRGARLVLVPHVQTDYDRLVRCELLDRGHAFPVVPLFESMEPSDTLGWDPHPSAKTIALMARFLAESLLAEGWVSGPIAVPLAELSTTESARRARELPDAELPGWRDAYRTRTAAALRARIAPDDLEGIQQIYGGLNLDGSMGTDFAAVLPAGRRLRVRVAPIDEEGGDLYPLELRVRVNGLETGSVRLDEGAEVEQVFPLDAADGAAPFEVWLEAEDWVSVKVRGRSWIESARVLELESLSR